MDKRSAVVIGINYREFPSAVRRPITERAGISPLDYAEADARDLAAILTASGYDVTLLLGRAATRRAIITAIRNQKRTATTESCLLIHFSGHGQRDPDDSHIGYLLPVDADPAELGATAIMLHSLTRDYLASMNVSLTLLDCCHSGYAAEWLDARRRGEKVRGVPIAETEGREFARAAGNAFDGMRGQLVFAACPSDKTARESSMLKHGLFTHHVLQWWQQSTDPDADSLWRHLATAMAGSGLPSPVRGGIQTGLMLIRDSARLTVLADPGGNSLAASMEGHTAAPPALPGPAPVVAAEQAPVLSDAGLGQGQVRGQSLSLHWRRTEPLLVIMLALLWVFPGVEKTDVAGFLAAPLFTALVVLTFLVLLPAWGRLVPRPRWRERSWSGDGLMMVVLILSVILLLPVCAVTATVLGPGALLLVLVDMTASSVRSAMESEREPHASGENGGDLVLSTLLIALLFVLLGSFAATLTPSGDLSYRLLPIGGIIAVFAVVLILFLANLDILFFLAGATGLLCHALIVWQLLQTYGILGR